VGCEDISHDHDRRDRNARKRGPAAAPTTSGADVPPDRLAINPRSPHFDADKLQRGIGIRFKGTVRNNVEEYCISEGWVRVQAGKTMDRKGNPLTLKLGPGRSLVRGSG
jgi:hypothetical protein